MGDVDGHSDNSLNLVIAKFCPNLRKLSTGFKNTELETLKLVFNGCQYLESIKIWCGGEYLSEKDALESVVKYSQNIYKLILHYLDYVESELLPEELESFFISWTNRVPQKLLSLIVVTDKCFENRFVRCEENKEIIKKYIKLIKERCYTVILVGGRYNKVVIKYKVNITSLW